MDTPHENRSDGGSNVLDLTVEQWLDRASSATGGLRDFGDDRFREGLDRFLTALRQDGAQATPIGWRLCETNLLQGLINRLRIQEALAADPSLPASPLARPLIIVGFPRTGTTHFHRLLGQDPLGFAPPFWQLWAPAPAAEPGCTDDPRIERAEEHLRFLEPTRHMHEMGATLPDECIWLLRNSFVSAGLAYGVQVPSYLGWVMRQDPRPIYAYYRLQLQILASRASGRHLVLKAPTHHWALPALLEAVPEARIVYTVREPVATLASLASYAHANLALWSEQVDRLRTGAACAGQLTAMATHLLAVLDSIPRDRFLPVHYRDIVADPLAVARRVYSYFDYPWSDGFEESARAWLAQSRQHKHGVHGYQLSDYVTPETLREFEKHIAPFCQRLDTPLR